MLYDEKVQIKASYWVREETKNGTLKNNTAFNLWINEDPNHKIAYDEEKKLLFQINALPQNFLDELKNEVKSNRQKREKKKYYFKTISSVAIAACTLLVLYFSVIYENIIFSQKYIAKNKIQNDIVLPDDSKVFLDTNTNITVIYYAKRREVFLSRGKAVFDVSSNKTRPFIIKTDRVQVKVLGTKFEVIDTDDAIQVNVKEGTVRVSNPNRHDNMIALVTKGKSLSLDKYLNRISLQDTDITQIANWSTGKLSFTQNSIKDILEEFSKYIDINISIQNDKISQLPVSGNFNAYQFDDFLSVLPLIHPIKIVKKDGEIIIKEKI